MPIVGSLEVTTPSEREVLITRSFDAPKQLVFDAHTKPELLKRWLYGPEGWSLDECVIELRAGGRIRYVWRRKPGTKGDPDYPDMIEMGLSGTFREVVVPDKTVHTEIFDEDWTGGETTVTTLFEEKNGKTTVRMTVLYKSKEARDMATSTPMAEGMEMGYARLDKILAE